MDHADLACVRVTLVDPMSAFALVDETSSPSVHKPSSQCAVVLPADDHTGLALSPKPAPPFRTTRLGSVSGSQDTVTNSACRHVTVTRGARAAQAKRVETCRQIQCLPPTSTFSITLFGEDRLGSASLRDDPHGPSTFAIVWRSRPRRENAIVCSSSQNACGRRE